MSEIIKICAFILGTTLMYSTPLIFTAIGGIFSERSGVANIGLEGMMYVGAFSGAAIAFISGNSWIGFLGAGIVAAIFGLIHAIACVSFNANQIVSGIAINFLAPGLSVFVSRRIFDGGTMTPTIPLDQKLPRPLNSLFENLTSKYPNNIWFENLETVFNQYITVYIAIATVYIAWYIIYKTRFGLRMRAVGEHPKAADTLGVNIYKIRYICVVISGFLAGLGGASISIIIVSNFRPGLVSGHGYIALAAMIFGKWKPRLTMFACMLFGATKGLQIFLGGPVLGLDVSVDLLAMIPYIITIIALVGFVGKSSGPSALGKPYKLDAR